MTVNRRNFLGLAAAAALTSTMVAESQQVAGRTANIRVVVFDGLVIFNLGMICKIAEDCFPGRSVELIRAWQIRQFEYTWLRTTAGQYRDFLHVTEDALRCAASALQLQLSSSCRERLMQAFLQLPVWPDIPGVIEELHRRGIRMAFLSNFTAGMIDASLRASDMNHYFEEHLTTDRVRAFKPSPRAYQMAVAHFGMPKAEIAFAAFASWDAAGAKWFGYPTIWINRTNATEEQLGVKPDAVVSGAPGLLSFIQGSSFGS
jgi:2-haloacid dehalogenase